MTPALARMIAAWTPYIGAWWASERARNFAAGVPEAELMGIAHQYYAVAILRLGFQAGAHGSPVGPMKWTPEAEALGPMKLHRVAEIGAQAWGEKARD